ncbi:trigger factor [Parasporobacterium paucivorans]|nr:FKBP-type peptidyl-prolyl cis-trans isomerase [Parasporobacterium paucivorans]
MGNYDKLEVAKADVEIQETAVDDYINSLLQSAATTSSVTEGTVADGDTLNINYTGYVDGATFDGGSAEGASLTIGSGTFIDGFESGLIGVAIGSTVTLNLTFPDPYSSNTDLSGKAVTFDVTVNSKNVSIVPELTDAWVAENAANFTTDALTTTDELRAFARKQLEDDALKSATWNALWALGSMSSYDEKEVATLVDQEVTYYEDSISSSYGMKLADYLTLVGQTQEEFEATITDGVKEYMLRKKIIEYVAEQEKVSVSSDEYEASLQEYADYYKYDSVSAMTDDVVPLFLDQIRLSLLSDKVYEVIKGNVKVVESTDAETTTAADETTAAAETTAAE